MAVLEVVIGVVLAWIWRGNNYVNKTPSERIPNTFPPYKAMIKFSLGLHKSAAERIMMMFNSMARRRRGWI